MSESYPDFVARFYDPVYARVRDGVDNDYYLVGPRGSIRAVRPMSGHPLA